MEVRGAAAPKEPMTYAGLGFEHWGKDLGLEAGIWAMMLEFEPQGWNLSHKAEIGAMRPGLGPSGWELGYEAGIWASRLSF